MSLVEKYLAEIGARVGRSKSAAKAAAVRDNLAAARAKRWPKKRKTKKQNNEPTFGESSSRKSSATGSVLDAKKIVKKSESTA